MIRKTTHLLGEAQDLVVDTYEVEREIGRALVLPGLGRTSDEYFHLSAILLHNQVSVVVPDFRFHPGRSSGDIVNFRLDRQEADVAALIDHFEVDAVLATSLSFRPSIRVLGDRGWGGRLVGIVPVVAPRETLMVVTDYDSRTLPDDYSREETLNIDGYDIGLELVDDFVRRGLSEVEATMADAERFKGTLHLIVGEMDTWVDVEQARLVAKAAQTNEIVVCQDVAHDFGRSVRRARQMFQTSAEIFLAAYGCETTRSVPLDVVIRSRDELRETGTTTMLGGFEA